MHNLTDRDMHSLRAALKDAQTILENGSTPDLAAWSFQCGRQSEVIVVGRRNQEGAISVNFAPPESNHWVEFKRNQLPRGTGNQHTAVGVFEPELFKKVGGEAVEDKRNQPIPGGERRNQLISESEWLPRGATMHELTGIDRSPSPWWKLEWLPRSV